MKTFRQHVKEIKLWMIPFWLGWAVMIFALLFIAYIGIYLGVIGTLPPVSGKVLASCMEITLFSPILGGALMVFAGTGIGRRKRCSKCGKVLSIKDFDRMGDSFLCPYCLNNEFGKY